MKADRRKIGQMRHLADLLDTSYQAIKLEIDGFRKRLHRVEQMIDDLDAAVMRRAAQRGTAPDAALRAGADVGWMVWIEQRKSLLNTERVRLLTEIETRKDRLAREFGRKEIAARLHKKALRRHRTP